MRKLSDIKDAEALDLLADVMDPLIEICSDPEIRKMVEDKEHFTRLDIVKRVIKEHKEPIMLILATLEGVPVEEYHCNVLTLPVAILELMNDPEVSKLFT